MSEVDALQILDKEKFEQVIEICFQFLSGKQQPSQCLTAYKRFCDNWNIELATIEPLIKSLLKILKEGVKFCKTTSQLQDDLKKLGLSEDQLIIFIKKWEKEYSSLAQATTEKSIDVNPLLDLEWKFGVTSASSELNTVGNVFLHMKLEIDKGNSKKEKVFFELQLPEFYAFLHEMEKARASLDYLS